MIYLDPAHCFHDQAAHDFYYSAPWSGQRHRYRAWTSGCTPEALEDNGVWQYAPDEVTLPLLSPDLAGHEAQHPAFLYGSQIPQEVRAIVARYELDQMVMLHLCASSERAVQLLHHSPNFLWFVGPFVAQASQGKPAIMHDLFGYSQKKLLEMAFGTATKGMINMLKKLPPAIQTDERRYFIEAMSDENCSAVLRYKQKCEWPLFKTAIRYRDMLQYPFARRLFTEDLSQAELQRILSIAGEIYRDTVRLGRMLRIDHASRLVSDCPNWRTLRLLHETWTRRLNNEQEAQDLARLARPFPEPPITGINGIQPINTESELLTEGRIMHHCVGGYGQTVRAGASYIYRIVEPERATLELRLARNGEWYVAQMKTHCNGKVSAKTNNFVQRWLLEAQRHKNDSTKGK